jgi:hypothetical protein
MLASAQDDPGCASEVITVTRGLSLGRPTRPLIRHDKAAVPT